MVPRLSVVAAFIFSALHVSYRISIIVYRNKSHLVFFYSQDMTIAEDTVDEEAVVVEE